jgi:hypothetical protein
MLDLARHVFQSEQSSSFWTPANVSATHLTLIGWDMIAWLPEIKPSKFELRPGVKVNGPSEIQYNARGSKVCSKLISMAGLEPATATIAEMDARDPRYVLRGLVRHLKIDTYPVFTWRAVVCLRPAECECSLLILSLLS